MSDIIGTPGETTWPTCAVRFCTVPENGATSDA